MTKNTTHIRVYKKQVEYLRYLFSDAKTDCERINRLIDTNPLARTALGLNNIKNKVLRDLRK